MSTNRRGRIRVKSYKKPNTTNETTPQPEIRATKNKNTPAPGEHEGIQKKQVLDTSIAQKFDQEFFEKQLNGVYIVVVQIRSNSPEPRFRRFFYVNLQAAQRRASKARGEGKAAYIVLAKLQVLKRDLTVFGGDPL